MNEEMRHEPIVVICLETVEREISRNGSVKSSPEPFSDNVVNWIIDFSTPIKMDRNETLNTSHASNCVQGNRWKKN